jgi:peptidoglycan/LPS O-acetylase OafA/YrhL
MDEEGDPPPRPSRFFGAYWDGLLTAAVLLCALWPVLYFRANRNGPAWDNFHHWGWAMPVSEFVAGAIAIACASRWLVRGLGCVSVLWAFAVAAFVALMSLPL